jgi:hypothetical protein
VVVEDPKGNEPHPTMRVSSASSGVVLLLERGQEGKYRP